MTLVENASHTIVREQGLSLVELMVAITLGSMLCLVATTLLLHSLRSQLWSGELARLQENGRYAQRFIARELAMAGFYGGMASGREITAGNLSADGALSSSACFNWLLGTTAGLEHIDNVDAAMLQSADGPLPSDCLSASDIPVEGTDILVIRRVKDRPHYLREGGVVVVGGRPAAGKTYLYIEDYAVPADLRLGNQLSARPYMLAAWEYYPQILFVRNWSVTRGDGVPALCRKRIALSGARLGNTACLVEGVENMQLQYGIDSDGDNYPDRFVGNLQSTSPARVIIARVHLLLRGFQEHAGLRPDRVYQLGQETRLSVSDGYQRRVFQTSSLLRNRGLVSW